MPTELTLEILKLARKPRTYIGPAAMAGLVCLVLIGLKYSNPFGYMQERLEQDFVVVGSIVNAALLTRSLLQGIAYMFLPLFTCIVFGDLIASEAADGTLRAILCRPVTRLRIAVSKYVVGAAYTVALTLGTGAFAYLIGWAFLGRGSLLVHGDGLWILPERTAIARLAIAYGLVAVGMVAVGSIAFAVSTFLSNSNGAIAAAVGVLWASLIVSEMEFFAWLRPYLLSTYIENWRAVMTGPIEGWVIGKSLFVMLLYAAVSLTAGLYVFERRDVLS